MSGPTYVPELQSIVARLTYDYSSRVGRLDMVEGQSCDMSGCIDTFTSIDDRVQRIETFAGGEPDTVYVRKRDDWSALSPA
jgi:hypothetical protein